MPISRTLTNAGAAVVLSGSVTRLAAADGSRPGQVTPYGASRKVFFDRASLFHASDLELIQVGQKVRFESDPLNSGHAVCMNPVNAEPYTDFSRSFGR